MKLVVACAVLGIAVTAGAVPVAAQPVAQDFSRAAVGPGDRVEVVTTDGRTWRGTVHRLDPDALTLKTETGWLELAEAETRYIDRRGDSVWSGVAGGAIVGSAVTVAFAAAEGCWNRCLVGFWAVLPVYAGIGAGVGAAIDWAVEGRREVFRAPARSGAAWRLRPLAGPGAAGVLVSLHIQ
jgi:hypothetical protein